MLKNLAAKAGDVGLIPGYRRAPGVGNDNPLQNSCWDNPVDRGTWRATVHGDTDEWQYIIMVDTCPSFVKTHRLYNTNSEPLYKLWTLGENHTNISLIMMHIQLWWGMLIVSESVHVLGQVYENTRFAVNPQLLLKIKSNTRGWLHFIYLFINHYYFSFLVNHSAFSLSVVSDTLGPHEL